MWGIREDSASERAAQQRAVRSAGELPAQGERGESEGLRLSPAWACVGGTPPIVLDAGETRVDTLEVRGPTWTRSGEPPRPDMVSGTVRLVYDVAERREAATRERPGVTEEADLRPLDLEDRQSHPFRLIADPPEGLRAP